MTTKLTHAAISDAVSGLGWRLILNRLETAIAVGSVAAGAQLIAQLVALRQAQRAEVAFQWNSLDAPLPGQRDTRTLADSLGAEDPRLEHMLSMRAVAAHWDELPLREREILLMRFRGGMTQAQIGQRLGISQMQVSRRPASGLTR